MPFFLLRHDIASDIVLVASFLFLGKTNVISLCSADFGLTLAIGDYFLYFTSA